MSVRFAPSPTGSFHIGNLRTAWVSHAIARAAKLPWVLRFEDIDAGRVLEGAREEQLRDMAALGLHADDVYLQSARHERHVELFMHAVREGQVYPCWCSRADVQRDLQGMASAPHGAPVVYSGRCRAGNVTPRRDLPGLAWRFRSPRAEGSEDFLVGRTSTRLGADGKPDAATYAPSYNWACAVDDAEGGHELLVRAWDLESVLVAQREVQAWVRASTGRGSLPPVFHASLVSDNAHVRLEKRMRGTTLRELEAMGVSAAQLGELFERSFRNPPKAPFPASSGETPRERTLAELGLPAAP